MTWIKPNIEQIIDEVKVLVCEGENIEYTRGVLEIVTSFIKYEDDMCHVDKVIELAKHIGLSTETISKLY
jgi:hypothetical protein